MSSQSSSEDSGSAFSTVGPPETLSILQPLGYNSSQCGYCAEVKGCRSRKKGGRSYGCWAHTLSCRTYKDLIDQGWRRSGKYLYKPDMRATCCPQYTISLDADAFSPSKSQRQLLHRFSHFVIEGGREDTVGWGRLATDPAASSTLSPSASTNLPSTRPQASSSIPTAPSQPSKPERAPKPDSLLTTAIAVRFNPARQPTISDDEDNAEFLAPSASASRGKRKAKQGTNALGGSVSSLPGAGPGAAGGKAKGKGKQGKANHAVDLSEMLHDCEWDRSPPEKPFKHRFEYVLEPASFTDEKYELFRQYQTQIHGEPDAKVTPKGFRRFLVDTPLDLEPTASEQHKYGSHHAKYILDGELIAFAVLDILPGAVSSVYFVWSPKWAAMGLGKVSALREAAMVREMRRDGLEDMTAYMMGFYIHTCPKMKYKADYQPSYLLDPETNVFYPWDECRPRLDLSAHASFSGPSPLPRSISPTDSSSSSLPIAIPIAAEPPALGRNDTARPLAESTSSAMSVDTADDSEEGSDDEDDDEEEPEWPEVPPPGCLDPDNLPKAVLTETCVLEGRTLVPLLFSSAWHDPAQAVDIARCLAALGTTVAGRVAMWVA